MQQVHRPASTTEEPPPARDRRWRRAWTLGAAIAVAAPILWAGALPAAAAPGEGEVQSLDGSGNNRAHPDWGRLGRPYSRVARAAYADGIGAPATGPNPRWISNRLINDVNQNVFSERGVTQWLWTWGQFLDHTFGLAQGGGGAAHIPYGTADPLETFRNDLGVLSFSRDAAAPGTGVTTPREQINTVGSHIDAYTVYGGSPARLDWLRDGTLDGDPANNAATLMLPGGYLPTVAARGGAPLPGPAMDVDGRLRANPAAAVAAGDQRANENIALTATHTLFAREHNRIVAALPNTLSAEQKFQLARRVVIAEQQWITFTEFLPAAGVRLPAYRGYNPAVDPTISNEFATVGYRAHSQIHGEFEVEVAADHYSQAQLAAFREAGIAVEIEGADAEIAIPLNVAFFNPGLLRQVGLGQILKLLGGEAQYKNDELIDNQLRSVLFQVPRPGQTGCIEPVDPACFSGVTDLGALDIARGREHGIPDYNRLRQAYGLAPRTSFRAITGETSETWPADPELTRGGELDDPDSLDVTRLWDRNGAPIGLDSPVAQSEPTVAQQRTPIAARLRAAYRDVNAVDAFTGMIAEPHLPGSEFGELQQAIWTRQFQALRDGDRFFYGNRPELAAIRAAYGIDFRRSLGEIIADNTEIPQAELRANVFVVPATEPLEPGRILQTAASRCLDVTDEGTADRTPVQLWSCHGGTNQGWAQLANGAIQVYGVSCLDLPGGTTAVIARCSGSTGQRWRFQGDGRIVHVASGRCLTTQGNGDGARVIGQACTGAAAQRWIR